MASEREALGAGEIEEGRRLLARASDAPWMVREDMDGDDDHTWFLPVGIALEDPSFPGVAGDAVIEYAEFAGDHHQAMDNARVIVWLRNHAAELLAATEELAAAREEVEGLRSGLAFYKPEAARYRSALQRIVGIGRRPILYTEQTFERVFALAEAALAPQEGMGNG